MNKLLKNCVLVFCYFDCIFSVYNNLLQKSDTALYFVSVFRSARTEHKISDYALDRLSLIKYAVAFVDYRHFYIIFQGKLVRHKRGIISLYRSDLPERLINRSSAAYLETETVVPAVP